MAAQAVVHVHLVFIQHKDAFFRLFFRLQFTALAVRLYDDHVIELCTQVFAVGCDIFFAQGFALCGLRFGETLGFRFLCEGVDAVYLALFQNKFSFMWDQSTSETTLFAQMPERSRMEPMMTLMISANCTSA